MITPTAKLKYSAEFTTLQEEIPTKMTYAQPNPIGPNAGAYMPYFYQSGRFLSYAEPRGRPPQRASSNAAGVYDFSSLESTFARSDGPQTVEQIIAHGYFAVPPGEPTTALISDRRQTSWMGLDDLIGQIRQRYQIYQQNMYELTLSACEANNAVFRQEADQGCPADARQRYSANKAKQNVYEQQRLERVNLWRDVSRVRTELPEAAQLYLSSYRKLSILKDLEGESP